MLVIFATFLLLCLAAMMLLLMIALRMPPLDMLLIFLCLTMTFEWYVQIRGPIFSVYDLSFVLAVPLFGYSFLRRGHYHNRYIFQLLILFTAYQFWEIVAQFVHPRDSSVPQLIWSSYKNYLIYLVFLLGGIVLASRPPHIQRWVFAALLASFGFEALVGLVQTASGGMLLNSGVNNRFLGFLTPIPQKLQGALPSDLSLLGGNDVDNGTFVGFIFRSIGTHRQSNYFAVSMIGGLAVCIAVLIGNRHGWLRRWAVVCGCLMLAALGFSFTRTGYVALVAMGAWYFVARMQRRARRRILIGTAVASLVLFLLVVTGTSEALVARLPDNAITTRLKNLFQPTNAAEFNFRTDLWQLALERVWASPVFGLGDPIKLSEIIPIPPALDSNLPLHNQVVGSIYYGGYILGILYILTHMWLLWISRKLSPHVRASPIFTQWAVAANLCFVGLVVESLTIDWMPFPSLQGLFWFMAGVAAMQYRPIYGARPVEQPQPAGSLRQAPVLAFEHPARGETSA